MSGLQQEVDRRKWPRFPVPECEVYLAGYLFPRYLRHPRGEPSSLVNISAGGLQVLARRRMQVKERVMILVKVPAFIRYMLFRGSVVWSKAVEGRGLYRIGIRFTATERETADRLETLRKDFFFRKRKTEEEKNRYIDVPMQ
jgi:Tfp pilus assembly protein PilZ